jgi:aldose 1-epimerase
MKEISMLRVYFNRPFNKPFNRPSIRSWLRSSARVAALLALPLCMGCATKVIIPQATPPFAVSELPITIGGQPVMLLSQPLADRNRAQILEVYLLPGRGMNIYKIRGYIPGKGIIDVLSSDSFQDAEKRMNGGPDDFNGNQSFSGGGPILIPFANRIRGQSASKDPTAPLQGTIDAHLKVGDQDELVHLPANWRGKAPGAETVAMHGLILNQSFATETNIDPDMGSIVGSLKATDFDGHWVSKANIAITAALQKTSFTLTIFAKNAGTEPLPIGIGWHPFFKIPSEKRGQVRLRIPALKRLVMNNYDDVFPTGKVVKTQNSLYDFTALQGRALKKQYLDDCFTDLERDSQDQAIAELVDPAGNYGLRIKAVSSQIRAFQVFAPLDQNFVAIEPQFNLGDPFGPEWKKSKTDTGMAILQPGETTQYVVELELFKPKR